MAQTSSTAIFIQDACYKHRFIRSKDTSNVVERPERLRAVKLGLATALARLEEALPMDSAAKKDEKNEEEDLISALDRMKLDNTGTSTVGGVQVIHSTASVPLIGNPAVKYIHGDIEGDVYLEKIISWAQESETKIGQGESEIPTGLPQGDLYLCPESIMAMEGALGTVCEAIDAVMAGPSSESTLNRAFVAVRPPGHHCGEDTPCGFCFVNNVAVGAAHAHLKHGINRAVIFDVDLHHGNGTQSVAWGINEETYRLSLEAEAGAPDIKPGLKVYYGSIHDIMSFPCEDGKPELIQAASVSIHESHGQWIENIHLQAYENEQSFHELYTKHYSQLITKAERFLDSTGGPGDDILVFISCGLDASEHEYTSMSRHGRRVPVSFFHRFTEDSRRFADKYAKGRLVSVLEGGYSDRALVSGALAHLSGLADVPEDVKVKMSDWWRLENLEKVEKIIKKKRGGRPSGVGASTAEPWLERAGEIFASMDAGGAALLAASARKAKAVVPAPTRVLRDRAAKGAGDTPTTSPLKKAQPTEDANSGLSSSSSDSDTEPGMRGGLGGGVQGAEAKKLPRVILKLGPNPNEK